MIIPTTGALSPMKTHPYQQSGAVTMLGSRPFMRGDEVSESEIKAC